MYTNKFFINDYAQFYSEEKYLKYYKHTFVNVNKNLIEDKVLDLRSNTKKILVALHEKMFHLLIDNLGLILYFNKKYDLEFILDDSDIPLHFYTNDYGKSQHQYFTFFLKILNDKKIKYKIINNKINDTILINNFWFINNTKTNNEIIETLCNLFNDCVQKKETKPEKIVYLSRINNITGTSLRTNNEQLVADFFKNKNIEIIEADTFKTFEDQINYFYNVKTLIGFTGTGLLNMLFMQNCGNVVEFTTPIKGTFFNPSNLTTIKGEELHHMYTSYAWSKKHLHMSIPNNFYYDSSLFLKYLNDFKILDKIMFL